MREPTFAFNDTVTDAEILAHDLLVVQISRTSVETMDLDAALRMLRRVTDTPALRSAMLGRLVFSVEGYDADPRELCEIAEVRRYFRSITEAWPYWPLYLDPAARLYKTLLGLLCEVTLLASAGDTTVRLFSDPHAVLATERRMGEACAAFAALHVLPIRRMTQVFEANISQ